MLKFTAKIFLEKLQKRPCMVEHHDSTLISNDIITGVFIHVALGVPASNYVQIYNPIIFCNNHQDCQKS